MVEMDADRAVQTKNHDEHIAALVSILHKENSIIFKTFIACGEVVSKILTNSGADASYLSKTWLREIYETFRTNSISREPRQSSYLQIRDPSAL